MNVSDVLLRVLAAHGVRHLFGIPGDAINDVMDAVRRQGEIDFVGVRHEEAGALAASAQAKLSGDLAACVGTAGPGAIHLLNGLYDARLDHAPVIAITGQVSTDFIGTQYHQEVRLERLFADVAVYSQTVLTEEQVPDVFLEACNAAITHRGVAHIALPTNVAGRRATSDLTKRMVPVAPGLTSPDPEACAEARRLIKGAERIVVLAGLGCSGCREELISFCEEIKAPIVRTLKAKEVIDDGHPQCIGGLGLLGGPPAVRAMDACELLIMAGTDFPYHDFYPASAKTIQIDLQSTQIGKRHPVDVALVGHVGPALAQLTAQIPGNGRSNEFLGKMKRQMRDWLDEQSETERSDSLPIHPPRVMRAVSEAAADNAIFVCDTGTVTAWSARHLRLRPGQRYTLSGGLASMAYGLPGAIGAQLANPGRQVFALVGDGAFAMLMGDFVTAVKYQLPIIVLIFNNAKLAFITLEQQAKGLPDYGTDLQNPDFAAIAKACGGMGFTVERPDQLDGVLGEALEQASVQKTPVILDIMVDPDALILPPKLSASLAMNFGLAKIREAFGT